MNLLFVWKVELTEEVEIETDRENCVFRCVYILIIPKFPISTLEDGLEKLGKRQW